MEENVLPPEPQSVTEPEPNYSKIYVVLIVVLVVILFAAGSFMLFNYQKTKSGENMTAGPSIYQQQTQVVSKISPNPTIIVSPMATTSADQTLNETDVSLQQAVIQINNDLNDLNKINTNLDSVTGL